MPDSMESANACTKLASSKANNALPSTGTRLASEPMKLR